MLQRGLFPSIDEPFARGYAYEPDFLFKEDEDALLSEIERLPFAQARYKGSLANQKNEADTLLDPPCASV